MRFFVSTLFLISLSFELANSKQFEQCEFAIELYEKHELPKEEIYKHLCIVSTLHTQRNSYGHLGIYQIGSMWWCGEDEQPGGSCNITCANLIDEDIADDVKCANLILSQQGVQAFGKVLDKCKETFQAKTDECIAEDEALISLQDSMLEVTSHAPATISTAEITYTTRTSTQTSTAAPQWWVTTSRSPFTFSQRTITTEKSTRRPFVHQTTQTASLEGDEDSEGSDAIVWVVAVILIALLITIFVVKYKSLVTNRFSYVRNRSFENAMSNL
jgi:lysozyme C